MTMSCLFIDFDFDKPFKLISGLSRDLIKVIFQKYGGKIWEKKNWRR